MLIRATGHRAVEAGSPPVLREAEDVHVAGGGPPLNESRGGCRSYGGFVSSERKNPLENTLHDEARCRMRAGARMIGSSLLVARHEETESMVYGSRDHQFIKRGVATPSPPSF